MFKHAMRIGLLSLAMVVGVAACGGSSAPAPTSQAPAATAATGSTPGGQGESSAEPTPTRAPVAAATSALTTAPTSAPVGTPGLAVGQTRAIGSVSNGLDKLASYSVHSTYKFDGTDKTGKAASGQMNFTQDVINASGDRHMHIAFTGQPLGMDDSSTAASSQKEYETFTVGGNLFLINAGKCQFVGSGTASLSAAVFAPDKFLAVDKATLVGLGELVNGTLTSHYTFTEAALSSNTLNGMKLVKGDAWISLTGYVVRIAAQLAGTSKNGETGTIGFQYDVDTVNGVPAIVAHADCVATTAANDIPLPAAITEKKVLGASGQSIITFKTTDSLKTVADFYRQSMPGQGWTVGKESVSGAGSIQMMYTKDAGKRTVTVAIGAAAGATTVFITDKTSS